MPSNPLSSEHVSVPLTNFSQFWLQRNDAFVALRATPNIPVANQFDQYYEWNRGDLFRDEAQERADGTKAAEMSVRVSLSNYQAKVWALRTSITDRQRANVDSQLRLERSKTAALMQKMMIRREREWQGTFFATGIWATDVSPSTKWGAAGATPIQEIRLGIETIEGSTGMRPNRITFGASAWNTFVDADEVLGRIEGGAMTSLPAIVQRNLVAQLFEVEEVTVMRSVYNSAAGLAGDPPAAGNASVGYIGSDHVLIQHAPMEAAIDTPSASMGFSWTGFIGATESGVRVRRYRDEDIESDWVETQMAFDYKVTAPELGYFLNDVRA